MLTSNYNIIVLNSLWPHPSHSVRSGNVVFFELLRGLAQQPGIKVSFLKINIANEPLPTDVEKNGISELRNLGVEILPALTLPQNPKKRGKLFRILAPRLSDFYPTITHKRLLHNALENYKPDVIFIPWNEWLTALCADFPSLRPSRSEAKQLPRPKGATIKFAYYGNPDPKSVRAAAHFDRAHRNIGAMEYHGRLRVANALEKFHLGIMKKYEMVGNVAANDAAYYQHSGHSNAFYIQNLWIDRFPNWRQLQKDNERAIPTIIGNVGKLGGTANTHGLEILGRQILPELRRLFDGQPFELHILGAGELSPFFKRYFDAPEVRLRGFVPDIDREILSSHAFLCVNNASEYKVGHTRYLHAWSLGSCVVAHRDAALSMPEMVHMKNSLLGQTPAEIAQLTVAACKDSALRLRIGEEGYKTFREYFTAEHVVPKIIEKITMYV